MFGNTRPASGGNSSGPNLESIQTECLGFSPLGGEATVRLTTPWTSAPSDTASLLSIASRRGLVAAAGPDQIILATTESVRKAFASPKQGDSDVRAFEPQLRIPAPMRISHLTFTADEKYLVMSAESGGGLAVYEVQSLVQGSSNTAFELSTQGESLRSLVANPAADRAEFCAVLTANGNLCMANLKDRTLSNPLKTNVSCLSWSTRGKQLCAGMGNGSICQMTPDGQVKAEISAPPISISIYVSTLTWLENNVFLTYYTTSRNISPPSSMLLMITRNPATSSCMFQRLNDPVEPYELRKAPHHSILRLREFSDVQDFLMVASTASTDIGVLTNSKTPLSRDKPGQNITNVFTTTEIMQDTRRAALPITSGTMEESVPIGVSLDLSGKEKVLKPIPSVDEIDWSPGPLPGLWVLTHSGVLCSWWVVYDAAIKNRQTYPGLAVMENTAASTMSTTPIKSASSFAGSNNSPFGSSTTPTATPMGSTSALGASPGRTLFGSAFTQRNNIGFAQLAQLGTDNPPWASTSAPNAQNASNSAFGQSSFSTPTSGASNQNTSSSAAGPTSTPATFGSAFGSAMPSFASSSGQQGFLSLGVNTGNAGVFGSGTKFGAGSFGIPDENATSSMMISPAQSEQSSGAFGTTSFNTMQNQSNDEPSQTGGPGTFGSGFLSSLQDAATEKSGEAAATTDDEAMDLAESTELPPQTQQGQSFASPFYQESTTPMMTPAPPRFNFASSNSDTSPFAQAVRTEASPSSVFGGTPQETPKPGGFGLLGFSKAADSPAAEPKIKREADESAQLPSDSTANTPIPAQKSTTNAGSQKESEAKATPEDALLPPDFSTSKKSSTRVEEEVTPPSPESNEPSDAPSDFEEADDGEFGSDEGSDEGSEEASEGASEGSGVDVAKELDPSQNQTQSSTPRNPFAAAAGKGPLVGEASRGAPQFPKPKRTAPRSPSPLRKIVPQEETVGARKSHSRPRKSSIVASKAKLPAAESDFVLRQRRIRERKEAEETQALVDEEDEEVQKVLSTDVKGTLNLDEFIAHSNVLPPAKDTIPAQVEAVYRDINAMVDTLGLNARAVQAFTKGHKEEAAEDGRGKEDLESPESWVLCEIDDLGDMLDNELHADLEDGRVQDLQKKVGVCQDLSRDMQRLRAKQEDLKRVLMAKLDPDQAEYARALPLSAEQAAQQNELRREYARFTGLLTQAEEALMMLKTKIAAVSTSMGRPGANAPTVDSVMRTISKMTSMAEKRSGDIDVLETQLRKMKLGPDSREGSPMRTPQQARRSLMMSPDVTPSRSFRHSVISLSGGPRGTPPRKKVSGFSMEEKGALMSKRSRRQAVLSRLKESVEKREPTVWSMEDME
ncbi:hypothetical protein E4U61_000756 [Claviceps capensis]|nr:hypothetical protein E4U61_000756 [Claviceps capensis]